MAETPAERATVMRGPLLAGLVLVAALLVLIVFFFLGGERYTLVARFVHAGGLVNGGEVRVAGRRVGTVTKIELTDDAQVDVTLSIEDPDVTPFHEPTRATIRAVGQAGVTNNYVDLSPGPASEPALAAGALLPASQTSSIVSLDAILDSFDPKTRSDLQDLVASSAQIYAGSGAREFNGMLAKLSPAFRATGDLADDLASDDAALGRLISSADRASTAIASRRPDLIGAVENSARAFAAIASQREALANSLSLAPPVLRQGGETLVNAGDAITAIRPALRDVPAAARPLRSVLDRLPPSLRRTTPTIRQLRRQIPALRDSIAGFAPLESSAVAALDTTGEAFGDSTEIFEGLRPYGPDLLLGIFNGLIGVSTAPYDYAGHYVHLEFVQSPQFFFAGAGSDLFINDPLVPGLFDLRTGLTSRCPGALHPPAPDRSNPWIPDPLLCDPSDNTPASVNTPP